MKHLFKILLVLLLIVAVLWLISPWLARQMAARMNPVSDTPTVLPGSWIREAHESLLVSDLHADPLLWDRDWQEAGFGHMDLPRMEQGNVGLQAFGIVTAAPLGQNFESNPDGIDKLRWLAIAQHWPVATWGDRLQRALFQAQRFREMTEWPGQPFMLIRNKRLLRNFLDARDRGNKVVGGVLALEGSHAIRPDSDDLQTLFDAGVRMIGLAHFFDNAFAGSAHGENQGGLTEAGRALLAEAQSMGMLVDLAHASPAAFDDTLVLSRAPLVVSHTGVQATCPGPRNLSDEQIEAIAQRAGVIGIGLFPGAICSNTLEGLFAAMEHVIELVGIDHVALGSDFDGAVSTPIDASGWPQVTMGLAERGYSDRDIRKIMGGNVVRILLDTLPDSDTQAPADAVNAD